MGKIDTINWQFEWANLDTLNGPHWNWQLWDLLDLSFLDPQALINQYCQLWPEPTTNKPIWPQTFFANCGRYRPHFLKNSCLFSLSIMRSIKCGRDTDLSQFKTDNAVFDATVLSSRDKKVRHDSIVFRWHTSYQSKAKLWDLWVGMVILFLNIVQPLRKYCMIPIWCPRWCKFYRSFIRSVLGLPVLCRKHHSTSSQTNTSQSIVYQGLDIIGDLFLHWCGFRHWKKHCWQTDFHNPLKYHTPSLSSPSPSFIVAAQIQELDNHSCSKAS
jgi:hypothetical protein